MNALLRSRWLLPVAALALLVFAASQFFEIRSGEPRETRGPESIRALPSLKPNVLFILIDTLRAHRLSAYGYERETSPMLDYMAQTGVRFANHLSQSSWTKCSMASLWTGLYPARTGVLRAAHAAPEAAVMPAEILRDAGFRTAGIWRNGWIAPNFGFGQGFEVYERPKANLPSARMRVENPHIKIEGTDNDTVDAALEFLRVHGRERWFLYLHLMDVHQYLYDEESALFGSTYSDVYDNSIRHTDKVVGRMLTHLAEQGLLQKTLVVISADHGEAFFERGYEGHARHVYRETTEVPFIIGLPFLLEPGIVVNTQSRNVDVWPTILDLLDLPPLPDTDGRSLLRHIQAAGRGQPLADEEPAFAHLEHGWGRPEADTLPRVAVADEGFRFVRTSQARGGDLEQLFDRRADPEEQLDVLEEQPEVGERLRALVEGYLESPAPPWGGETPSIELDEMELNQLRALGYSLGN